MASLLDASLSSSTNDALLHYALAQEHGAQAADGLARYLTGGDDHVLKEFSVAIRVAPSGQGFRVEIVLRYKATLERYIVGMTSESRDIEPMTMARIVTETFVVPDGHANVLPNTSGSPVTVEATSVGGTDGGNMAPLSFSLIPAKRRKALLKKAGIARDPASCALFEANPTRDLNLSGEPVAIQYTATLAIEKQESYTFWASDRPLYVRSIDVDLSALTPAQIEAADVNLFVGNVGWAPFVNGTGGRWSFPLDRWLVSGHGIMAAWPSVQ